MSVGIVTMLVYELDVLTLALESTKSEYGDFSITISGIGSTISRKVKAAQESYDIILWPLAASFVLAVPLILMTYISKQQSSFVSNDLEMELQSVGRAPENQAKFHQWTQVEENLLCANAALNGDCKQERTALVGIHQG